MNDLIKKLLTNILGNIFYRLNLKIFPIFLFVQVILSNNDL